MQQLQVTAFAVVPSTYVGAWKSSHIFRNIEQQGGQEDVMDSPSIYWKTSYRTVGGEQKELFEMLEGKFNELRNELGKKY